MITIINYNAGNIKSIQNMLKRIGAKSCISSNAEEIGTESFSKEIGVNRKAVTNNKRLSFIGHFI